MTHRNRHLQIDVKCTSGQIKMRKLKSNFMSNFKCVFPFLLNRTTEIVNKNVKYFYCVIFQIHSWPYSNHYVLCSVYNFTLFQSQKKKKKTTTRKHKRPNKRFVLQWFEVHPEIRCVLVFVRPQTVLFWPRQWQCDNA